MNEITSEWLDSLPKEERDRVVKESHENAEKHDKKWKSLKFISKIENIPENKEYKGDILLDIK